MKIRVILMSPLVHFFALGALIFAAYSVLNPAPDGPAENEIILSETQALRLAEQFQVTWNRPPTADELTNVMEHWVTEEAFIREAEALGLDRNDAAIRQRLSTKMQFLIDSEAASLEPDETTLQSYLDDNPDKFMQSLHFAFEQVLLPEGADVDTLLFALNTGDADPSTVGAATMLARNVPLSPSWSINRDFGKAFADEMADIPDDIWQGPLHSGFGQHLVRVRERKAARLPALDEIRQQVEREWRNDQTDALRDAFTRNMLARYSITMPTAQNVLSQ